MSEYTDLMEFSVTAQGEWVVLIGTQEARTIADVMALAPNASPMNWADILNELAHGGDFEVIEDPAAFRAQYEATLSDEDPEKGWSQDAMRLRDFGIPDFDEITVPKINGGTLVYFVRDVYTGLPYRAEIQLGDVGAEPTYAPLDLKPTPEPAAYVPPVMEVPGEEDDDARLIGEPASVPDEPTGDER
ncbi:hypothetical protein ACERZ8_04000 [Tateyamaria armeniaca]|uniref:Uncharacterized protein n=1 Tax=Tateyamaria armeniaca TaxID=2518930 RepID=A0ABW8UQ45_9RHOB